MHHVSALFSLFVPKNIYLLTNISFRKAAQNDRIALLHVFLQKGLPLETKDAKGRTALHWACYQDHDRLAEWLIRKGAGITTLDVVS